MFGEGYTWLILREGLATRQYLSFVILKLKLRNMRFKRTTLMSAGCLAVLAGIAMARLSLAGLESYWWLGSLAVSLVVFRSRSVLALVCVIFFGLTLGWWRGGIVQSQVNSYEPLFGESVVLMVKADSDGTYTDRSQIIFDAGHVVVAEPAEQELPGRLTVAGFGTADVRRGDTVRVEGKLYPTRGGKQARISFAKLSVELRSSSVIEELRREFLAGLRSALPEPQASFGAGLIIGGTRDLPDANVEALRAVGLSHIVAVSGYNLTILAEVFGSRVGKRSKFRGLVLSLLMVGTFVLLAGTSASIARAAVVAVLAQVARYYGRGFKPVLLLAGVAAYSALGNPLNLWNDIGWHLSFLAFFGVLVLAPLIQKRFFGERKPSALLLVVLASMSAQIMTIPYVLLVFSQVSLVSLLANVLVVPLIPLAMLLVAVSGIAWMTLPWPATALWLAWPASILLTFLLDIATLLSRLPFASVERSLSLIGTLICYSAVLVLCLALAHKTASKTEAVLK